MWALPLAPVPTWRWKPPTLFWCDANPLDVVAIVQLSRATYRKMIQNLVWATGYDVVAIPLAAGALYA